MKILLLFMLCISSSLFSEKIEWLHSIDTNSIENYKTFYDFAVNEYEAANYGTAKDILENLCLKTDEFPKSYYYIAQVYKNIKVYKNDDMYRKNLLMFVESVKNKDLALKEKAYHELNSKIESKKYNKFEFSYFTGSYNSIAIRAKTSNISLVKK